MKNPLESSQPAGELFTVIDNINTINKLMRHLLENTDRYTFTEHKEWMLSSFDLLPQQVDIAKAYCDELSMMPLQKPRKRASEALQ